MQTEKNSNSKRTIAFRIICWCLVAACMCAIFYFSSCTADESSVQSGTIIEFLERIFGENFVQNTTLVVRKSAHFLEYTGLGLLFGLAFYAQLGKPKTVFAILCSSAYAVTDEVHQIFVEGRSCEAFDWMIDTAGATLGALAFLLIYLLIRKIKNKKAIDS